MSQVNQGLLGLASLLVILSLIRIVGSVSEEEQRLELAAILPSEVQSISISSPDARIEIRRTGTGWTVDSPQQLPADTQKVEALLADWAGGMSSNKAIGTTLNQSDESTLGLDTKQRRELRISNSEGALVHLEVGRSVAGGSHYVRTAGTDEVFQARIPGGQRLDPALSRWVAPQD